MNVPIWPSLAALFFVLIVIPLSLWLFKSLDRLRPAQTGPLRIVHRTVLGPREQLAIVRVGDKTLVIGITAHAINTLCELSDIELDRSPELLAGTHTNTLSSFAKAHPFAALLQGLKKR